MLWVVVEGIKNIDSKSENGSSTINVEFDTNIDLDNAANDIRERVARIVDRLPSEVRRSTNFKTISWIYNYNVAFGNICNLEMILELGDYVERYLVDQFSSVKNVGTIRTGGLRDLSVRVWIDPIKLAVNNLTIQEVEEALRKENVSLTSWYLGG